MAKKLFLLLFLLILAESVSAAIIHGSVYDISLNKVTDIKIEVDTTPKQFYVSKDGDYEFNVPIGTYTIKASTLESSASEEVVVEDEGIYVLDLILFPLFDEETGLIEESDEIRPEDYFEERRDYSMYYWIGGIVLLAIIFYLAKKKRKPGKKKEEEKEEGSDLDKVVKIIKQEGGRTTQKEIRKHFPLSEAKISLMIAELEHKGVVKKIKKGRGNIIILEK